MTQARLKELINYEPSTGIFTWIGKTSPKSRIKIGAITATTLNSKGYTRIQIDGKGYEAQRLAVLYMTGSFPNEQVDHINHIRSDNAWSNLRVVTPRENQQNKSMHKNNTSGRIGVSFDKTNNKWMSSIMIAGKSKTLGRFEDKDDAIKARVEAEIYYKFHKNHGRSA